MVRSVRLVVVLVVMVGFLADVAHPRWVSGDGFAVRCSAARVVS